MQERIKTFVLDASRVSSDLDKISTRDQPEVRAKAVETATRAYEELLERQNALTPGPADTMYLQFILDGIRARLKFLSQPAGSSQVRAANCRQISS